MTKETAERILLEISECHILSDEIKRSLKEISLHVKENDWEELKPVKKTVKKVTVTAYGDTFGSKDVLKEKGFRYCKEEKSWDLKVPAGSEKQVLESLRKSSKTKGVIFGIKESEKQ